MFKNGDTIFGCRPLKITSDTDKTTTLHKYRFCNRRNIFTIYAADIAREETECTVILDEKSALLDATTKDTGAAMPISVTNFT